MHSLLTGTFTFASWHSPLLLPSWLRLKISPSQCELSVRRGLHALLKIPEGDLDVEKQPGRQNLLTVIWHIVRRFADGMGAPCFSVRGRVRGHGKSNQHC